MDEHFIQGVGVGGGGKQFLVTSSNWDLGFPILWQLKRFGFGPLI